jgi:DNA-binding MarR family transcriptional regulator
MHWQNSQLNNGVSGHFWVLSCRNSYIALRYFRAEGLARVKTSLNDQARDDIIQTLAAFRRELRLFLQFSKIAAENAGLSPQQHQALLAIHGSQNKEMSVGEVAEYLLLRPHSASGLISRLEDAGLVARSETRKNTRQKKVRLTDKAIQLLSQLSAAHQLELKRLRPLLVRLLSSL